MSGSTGFVSVIARNLYWPIATELTALEAAGPIRPNDLQTNSSENGHALAVVILGVLALESAINRAGLVHGDRHLDTRGKLEPALGYLKMRLNGHSCSDWDCPMKVLNTDALFEVFVVRDVIAHNHLWSGDFVEDPNGNWLAQRGAQPEPGFGDVKFQQYVDLAKGVTKHLRLNIVPTRVWRQDAYLALQTLFRALDALDHLGKPLGIRNHPFVMRGKVVLYEDFVEHIDSMLVTLAAVP
jgi:hypothetical protein